MIAHPFLTQGSCPQVTAKGAFAVVFYGQMNDEAEAREYMERRERNYIQKKRIKKVMDGGFSEEQAKWIIENLIEPLEAALQKNPNRLEK